jgi:hypothetical protein
MTPLRFVDLPKIRTVTTFGDKLLRANSAFINTNTNTRIKLYEKIIEMLETRMLCYSDMAKELKSSGGYPGGVILPLWYSDNIADYWDIAGLPRSIPGVFYVPGTGNNSAQIPAVLSFVTNQSRQEISGWYLAIGDSNSFSIFVESNNSAKTIYSRKGKMPLEKKLQLRCTLYINEGANSPIERDIIERSLRPYEVEAGKGINARIIFDGNNFEIRGYPAIYGNSLVFRGIF